LSNRHALIIAADQYDDDTFKQLRAPAKDAEELQAVLGDSQIGGFQVTALINASSRKVQEEVERFFKHRNLTDLLLLYFSCHGVKDQRGRLHLAMPDTRFSLLAATGVAANFINDQIDGSRSRKIVLMLDCCYSGAFARGYAARRDPAANVSENFEGKGRVVITASDALEYAFEDEVLKSEASRPSLFTSAVVRGLRTGDADIDQDGKVSVDELYDYTFKMVRARTPNQTPGKNTTVYGPIYIASNPKIDRRSLAVENDVLLPSQSQDHWDRIKAADALKGFTSGSDPIIAQAAQSALDRLSSDRERLVRASALEALGNAAQAHFERGLVLGQSNDRHGSIREFRKVVDADTGSLADKAHFNLGVLFVASESAQESIEHFTAATESHDPTVAACAAFNLACLHLANGQEGPAVLLLHTAMEKGDDKVKARAAFLLARVHEEAGRPSIAWRLYGTVTDLKGDFRPKEAESRYLALAGAAKTEDIIIHFLGVAGHAKPQAYFLNWLGAYYAKANMMEKSRTAYEELRSLGDPEYSPRAEEKLRNLNATSRARKPDGTSRTRKIFGFLRGRNEQ
jgi:uncharacterized caspase-like protein